MFYFSHSRMVKTFQFYYTQYNDHFQWNLHITLQNNFLFFYPDDSKTITTRERAREERRKNKNAKTVAVAIVFPFQIRYSRMETESSER